MFYAFMSNVWTETTVFNIGWIFNTLGTLFLTVLITRDKNAFGFLLFPITVMLHILGMSPSYIWYIITIILFTVKLFSADIVGNLLFGNIRKGYEESGLAYRRKVNSNTKGLREAVFEKRLNKLNAKIWNEKDLGDLYDAIKKGRGKL